LKGLRVASAAIWFMAFCIVGFCVMGFGMALLAASPARAVDAISVRPELAAIDLTDAVEWFKSEGGRAKVSTAAGSDGVVRSIEVPAREQGSTDWAVIALNNASDEQIDRLIVVPHYQMVGSHIFWPDLGQSRVVTITQNAGDRPDRQDSATADIFRITLDPGTTVTYILELRTDRLPHISLWEPDTYKDKVNSFTLYHGIVIGIAGLLALFLTILFVVKGSIMFPAAAALGWAVLIYIGVDFGFWGRVFDMSAGAERIWRAGGEAILAATLLVFLFAYLNLNRWHVRYSHILIAWLAFMGTLVAVALVNPPVASGIARLSLLVVAIGGFGVIIFLAIEGFDRAVLLIPTWFLLVCWVVAAALAVGGMVTNDIVAPALLGGLVLIVMLIGFTVMQHAFAGGGTSSISDVDRKALALTGAGDLIWDWDVAGDRVFTSPETETLLGLKHGALEGPAAQWTEIVHPLDRDRVRAALDSAIVQGRGRLVQDFRVRTPEGHAMWFVLKARPVVGSDGEVIRLVGTLTDISETKVAEERLLQDAIHDNLTGLPNRQLFVDRIDAMLILAKSSEDLRPAVMVMDLDRFKQVNDQVGLAVGDSILLTFARRLSRLLKPEDSLARLPGDQFGLLLVSENDLNRVAAVAEACCKTIRQPIAFNDREISITASIGIALMESSPDQGEELLKDAELAMYASKRARGDHFEIFKPGMRNRKPERMVLESELRRALTHEEIALVYRPVVRLENRLVAGFEALTLWEHPQIGRLSAFELVAMAEEIGLVGELARYAIERAARQLSSWQRAARARLPLFTTIGISSRELLRSDVVDMLRAVIARANLPRGTLKLELTEAALMENPEQATQVLKRLREFGAGLSLSDFGTGHSSLVYLPRFPFDTIKIDRAFVRANPKAGRPPVLRSIIGLAHDVGMAVVAEGVDTEADVNDLYQLGCEYAQGAAFGRPVSGEEAQELVLGKRLEAIRGVA
jgi:diguanylate cyclase (GGDEF)-like protein/PAS domain S-box-containing protein